MEKFIAANPAFVYFVMAGLLTLIGWLVKMAVKDSQEKIKEHKKEIEKVALKATEIENNYKNEFKKIREEANDNHTIVMGALGDLRVQVAKIQGKV